MKVYCCPTCGRDCCEHMNALRAEMDECAKDCAAARRERDNAIAANRLLLARESRATRLATALRGAWVSGPDADGLVWMRIDAGDLHASLSQRADSIMGRALLEYRRTYEAALREEPPDAKETT